MPTNVIVDDARTNQPVARPQHNQRTPMDRLMIQSFLNFSEAAPDALGIGQEMNLRFGKSTWRVDLTETNAKDRERP